VGVVGNTMCVMNIISFSQGRGPCPTTSVKKYRKERKKKDFVCRWWGVKSCFSQAPDVTALASRGGGGDFRDWCMLASCCRCGSARLFSFLSSKRSPFVSLFVVSPVRCSRSSAPFSQQTTHSTLDAAILCVFLSLSLLLTPVRSRFFFVSARVSRTRTLKLPEKKFWWFFFFFSFCFVFNFLFLGCFALGLNIFDRQQQQHDLTVGVEK
jgi:hypothetical protein